MLLRGLDDIAPGTVVGAPVYHPERPEIELLKPGVPLDARLIARLRSLEVTEVWVEDDLARDLDAAVAGRVAASRRAVYTRLRDDLAAISTRTVTASQVHDYRAAIRDMVCELIAGSRYAGVADAIFRAGGLATHSANVAYLCVMAGLELEAYIVKQQPRLSHDHARDLSILGLCGMLHDVGKSRLDAPAGAHHEIVGPAPDGYGRHTIDGAEILREGRVPARVINAVLHHHQRFDGTGWPDLAQVTRSRSGPAAGTRIHIFARIVGAANVLENLLREADAEGKPPVAALAAFASARFRGWFDPLVQRAVLRRIPPFAVGSEVRLSDGRRAAVVAPNLKEPCRPQVRAVDEQSGEARILKLQDHPDLVITQCVGVDVREWDYRVPQIPIPGAESAPVAPAAPADGRAAA